MWLQSGVLVGWTMDGIEDRWPDRAEELMPNTRQRLRGLRAELTAPKIGRIHRRRFEFEEAAAALFADVDVLLTPTTAVPAFAAEGPPPGGAMSTPFTMLANLCWNPATSVPCGFTSDGLPVGLQIVARRHRDDCRLRLARILEQTQPWPQDDQRGRRPVPPDRQARRSACTAVLLVAEEALDLGDEVGGVGVVGVLLVVGLLEAGEERLEVVVVGDDLVDAARGRPPTPPRARWCRRRTDSSSATRRTRARAAVGDDGPDT